MHVGGHRYHRAAPFLMLNWYHFEATFFGPSLLRVDCLLSPDTLERLSYIRGYRSPVLEARVKNAFERHGDSLMWQLGHANYY